MRSLRPLLLLPLVALLTACPTTAPRITALLATPDHVAPNDAVLLSWTITGGAPSTLTVTPGVGDVTGQDTVTVYPTTTTTYTLTASNAGGSDSDQVTVTVETLVDVHATVLGVDGVPAAGVHVAVPGRPSVASDGSGHVTLLGVPTPYDIATFNAAGSSVVSYLGLTRPDPTLLALGTPPGTERFASLYGQVSGGSGYPEPANTRTFVAFGSERTRASAPADSATGGYEIKAMPWYGDTDSVGQLHALQWLSNAGGLPTDYVGYGIRALTLRPGITGYLMQDIVQFNVPEANLSGAVVVPPGLTLVARSLGIAFDDGGAIPIANELSPAAAFTYTTPVIASSSLVVSALANGPSGEIALAATPALTAGAANALVSVPSPSAPQAPADGTAGVTAGTEFRWASPHARAHLLTFSGPAGAPTVHVITGADAITLPDLSALGLSFPTPGASYDWQLVGLEPYADADAAAGGPDGFLSAWPASVFYRPLYPAGYGATPKRGFTASP